VTGAVCVTVGADVAGEPEPVLELEPVVAGLELVVT
jgi:hypothetical protein